MARAKRYTLLSLDRYAQIMGIHPVHFSGGTQVDLPDGRVLFPLDNAQNNIWPQYSWQDFDQTSREELAMHIANAEYEVAKYLGYFPAPTWVAGERHNLPEHFRPSYAGVPMAYNVAGNLNTLRADYGEVIAGGRRAVSLIQAGAAVVYSDIDNDTWKEIATVTVPVAGVPTTEVKCYFVNHNGDREYEVRAPKNKTYSGGNVIFTFNSWQMIQPELCEALPTNDFNGKYIDMNDPLSLVSTVDVYREYNDTTQPHAVFTAEDPNTGNSQTANGFIWPTGSAPIVGYREGSYDATTGAWVPDINVCRYADYMDLWYYCGMRDQTGGIYTTPDDYMPDDIAVAIAYIATARLERVFYANNNATALASRLREDLTAPPERQLFLNPADALTNPFGTRRGEFEAWRRIQRYRKSYRTGGAL